MPRVVFTANLKRHVDCPAADVEGATVRDVLDKVFENNPKLRGYVVDELGRLRKHMVIFVDDAVITDRQTLSDRLRPESEVYVMQALSGG